MQARAYIFSFFFGIVFCYLNIHPFLNKVARQANIEKEQTCSKSKCMKEAAFPGEKDCNEENDCDNEGCNPFLPCSMGYCCYLVENFISYGGHSAIPGQKNPLVNDNRILKSISECWHPPEQGS